MAGGSRCSSLSCSIRSCGCCTCCCPECAAICDSLPPSSAASEALASSRDSSSCCSGAMLSLPWSRASSVSSSWLAVLLTPSSAECSAAAMGAEEEEEGCGLGPSSSRVVEPAGPSSSDTELAFVSGRRRVLTMWMRSGLQSEKVMDLGIGPDPPPAHPRKAPGGLGTYGECRSAASSRRPKTASPCRRAHVPCSARAGCCTSSSVWAAAYLSRANGASRGRPSGGTAFMAAASRAWSATVLPRRLLQVVHQRRRRPPDPE